MIRRLVAGLFVALVVSQVGATPAGGEPWAKPPLYYSGRADLRLCPSPMCGGLWISAVNTGEVQCSDPAGSECYVASTTIARSRLAARFAEGRALAWGQIGRGHVAGFPKLGVLVVSEVWVAPRPLARARGSFYAVRGSGRAIAATVLNASEKARVSKIDLSATGATAAQRRRAHAAIAAGEEIVVVGRIVRRGGVRTLVAFQLYQRAYP